MLLFDQSQAPTHREAPVRLWTCRSTRLGLAIAILAWLSSLMYVQRGPLLQTLADRWIVSDPVTPADVAVVLGGRIDVRPFEAAKLYREGLVKRVLVSRVADDRAAKIGATLGHTEINRRVLILGGVPPDAIETFGVSNASTYDEALALKAWADRHNATTFIVPTEIFSARRVRWTMYRTFAGEKIRVYVPAFDPPQYTRTDWWTDKSGAFEFPVEVIKYINYRLTY